MESGEPATRVAATPKGMLSIACTEFVMRSVLKYQGELSSSLEAVIRME